MALREYNKKRNFAGTTEPEGKKSMDNREPIFVVQYHKARAKHYDFRLEWRGALLSWAVPKGVSLNPNDKRLAVRVEDHPLDYANFSGIIPKGNYGAGSVEIYDRGTFTPSYDIGKGLKKGHIKFVLNGQKLKGEFSLVKMDEKNWLIIKSNDEFAKSGRKRGGFKLPFDDCDVQLATLSKTIPSGKGWLFEIKYDGYRLISFVEKGKVKCLTRGKQDYTSKFEDIAKSLCKIDEDSFVVDGEVVAFDENGRSDFALLRERMKNGGAICYVIFDLLALNGQDLRALPLRERQEKLNRLFSKEQKHLMLSTVIEGNGKKCFEFAKKNNLEGIMAKRADSVYAGKRSEDWLKIKCYQRQEFVVCGYLTTEKNQKLSALVLGYYIGKNLIYAGKVGTGFNEKDREELSKKLGKLKKGNPPTGTPKNLKANFVTPWLVVEIQYSELTKDGHLRQPSFIGLREDKKAKDVKLEVAK